MCEYYWSIQVEIGPSCRENQSETVVNICKGMQENCRQNDHGHTVHAVRGSFCLELISAVYTHH